MTYEALSIHTYGDPINSISDALSYPVVYRGVRTEYEWRTDDALCTIVAAANARRSCKSIYYVNRTITIKLLQL